MKQINPIKSVRAKLEEKFNPEHELKYICDYCGHETNSVGFLHGHMEDHLTFFESMIDTFMVWRTDKFDAFRDMTKVRVKETGSTISLNQAESREDLQVQW